MKLPSLSTTHYRGVALLWTVGILVACLLPTGALEPVQRGVGIDKLAHFVLFAGFGGLWMRVLCPPSSNREQVRRRALVFILVGAGFAAVTEGLQQIVPVQRVADPYDLLADLFGLVTAVVGYGYGLKSRPSSQDS